MRQLRYSAALAVQAGSRMLLAHDHDLSPAQRLTFTAISIWLVIFAGMMSGLTLGLCSMDLVELEVLKRSGTATEQLYAAAIMPIVSNQHFLLVTLLLCNAGAMEALPLFLDRLADPVTAILISVTAVLVFGEILPQAVCSRYGLAIGYYCAWLVRGLMAVTSPISYPIGKLLDFLLGQEHRALFRRGQLKALVDIHGADEGLGGNLSEDEIKVICGALDLTNKTARKSMTPLNKVFMLPADARLNMSTMRAILASGHSRIPVYTSGDRSSIIGLILVKELLQYKTHQEVPVSEVRMRSLPRLPADTPMYDMLKLFQTGRSHMVVLTDTPATARTAAEAAAAAAHAAAAAAAAEADGASNSSKSSGNSPLASVLRGKDTSRKQRHQFQSPLLQPAEEQQHQQGQKGGSVAAQTGSTGGAWIAGEADALPQSNGNDSVVLGPEQEMLGFGFAAEPQVSFLAQQQHWQEMEMTGSPAGSFDRSGLGFGSSSNRQSDSVREGSSSTAPAGTPGLAAAAGGRTVQFHTAAEVLGPRGSDDHLPQQQPGTIETHRRRDSSGSASGSEGGVDGDRRMRSSSNSSNKTRSPHARSLSGPLPNVFLAAPLLPPWMEGAPEGVAVPIGIITIEDVIEELMQAEIVDETDLYLDNERTIAVNAAQLAQSLPAQLRKALAPTTARSPVAGAARVTVRKLIKQRSASSLGIANAAAAAGSNGAAGSHAVLSDGGTGVVAVAGASNTASTATSGGGGVAAAVTAGLAAAAAAVTVGSGDAARGGQRSAEKQPLLAAAQRSV